MEDNTPIKWAYPFKSNSTSADGASSETSNPELYFQALAQAKDGFYPMGASGLWHGGVHFDEGTAGTLEQSSVRCIADGEVIAYRIDELYPKTLYSRSAGRGSRGIGKDFSTGFVLVKHKLQPPLSPAPAPASGTPAAAPTSAPTLTFYSLYMHLLDWNGYQASDAPQPPRFMSEPLYSVKANKATSPLAGLRVREQANSSSTVLAILPKGCRIKLGDADSAHPNWRKLVSILEGCSIPTLSGETERWVYANETEETGIADIRLVADRANDSEPTLGTPPKGLKIYKEGNASSKVIGLLPTGVKFSLEDDSGAYRKLKAITAGQDTAPLTANCVQNVLGYVLFDDLEVTDKTPPPFDEVQLLDPAIDIKAGDLIGHIGQYQNFEDDLPRPVLHLQVFTCEALPAFISQCRELAKDLPNEQKTLAMVNVDSKMANPPSADTKVVAERNVRVCSDSPKEGCWAKVQQYVELKAKKAGFGSFDNAHNRYPMDAAKKTELADEFDLDVAELPDTVDFLLESYRDDGSDRYPGKNNIPATHARRKVGVLLKTPLWVEREKLSTAGQRVSISGELPAWKNFPLSNRLDGELCGYKRILPRAAWSSLDQQHKAIAPDNIRWWYVTVADAQGRDISGWVPEQNPTLSLHSPWEWPGFSGLEDKQPLDTQLARQLNADGSLRGAEAERYLAQIDAAERGDILSSLYDIIDLPNQRGERDQKLSAEELKIALGKPWLAQQLSLLSTHFESEWYWSEAKWNALDSLMAPNPGQPNPNWEAEKTRIKALSWWDKLSEKHEINTDGKAWHFHPIGLISNCLSDADDDHLKWLKVPFGQLTFDVEGNDIDDPNNPLHRYFSRVVHWPGGNSGVTIGRGYDLGQRPNPGIDLEDVGIREPLLSWLIGAKGLSGQAAKNYLDSASAEIKKIKITRKQQYKLFIPVYNHMKSEVIRISNKTFEKANYGILTWENVRPKVQDIVVDLIYRGDYTVSSRAIVQKDFVENNLGNMKEKISNQANWAGVPPDRFTRRAEYLNE